MRDLVREIERLAGIDIQVVRTSQLNGGGPTGQGQLEVDVRRSLIFAPTNGYFPDGAVRHELLHLERFLVHGVPMLVLANDRAGVMLDNAIEHVVIVPAELRHHPERYEHWEATLRAVCSELHDIPPAERDLAICMHWTFLRHVLPSSPQVEVLRSFAIEHALLNMADRFADQFMTVIDSKVAIAELLVETFPLLPTGGASLQYIRRRSHP